uniref:DUF4939 domain-containing protein n=1 Tax=Cyprinodon variegatus TaxID=28743 RepID=A0A3Q2EDW7_CYPVA
MDSAEQTISGPNIPPPRSPAVTSSEFRPSLPERFSGNMKDCKGFLFQCRLIFLNSPGSFSTDYKKITFILSQLTGRALEWAQASYIVATAALGLTDLNRQPFDFRTNSYIQRHCPPVHL